MEKESLLNKLLKKLTNKEEKEVKICESPKCNNLVEFPRRKYCSKKCNDIAYYYRNHEKKLAYQKEYTKLNYEREKEKKKIFHKKWYQKNKARQNANVLKNYYRNKERWDARGYVDNYRNFFLKALSNECTSCGKKEINIISIKDYKGFIDTKKKIVKLRTTHTGTDYLNELIRYLKPFCSRVCSNKYRNKNE